MFQRGARFLAAAGAVALFLGVAAGAFGAHALAARLEPRLLAVFETGVRYQLVHALALIGAGVCSRRHVGFAVAAWAYLAGIVLFSGSLYALALTGVTMLGAVTPFGGASFLVGHAALAWALWRSPP